MTKKLVCTSYIKRTIELRKIKKSNNVKIVKKGHYVTESGGKYYWAIVQFYP